MMSGGERQHHRQHGSLSSFSFVTNDDGTGTYTEGDGESMTHFSGSTWRTNDCHFDPYTSSPKGAEPRPSRRKYEDHSRRRTYHKSKNSNYRDPPCEDTLADAVMHLFTDEKWNDVTGFLRKQGLYPWDSIMPQSEEISKEKSGHAKNRSAPEKALVAKRASPTNLAATHSSPTKPVLSPKEEIAAGRITFREYTSSPTSVTSTSLFHPTFPTTANQNEKVVVDKVTGEKSTILTFRRESPTAPLTEIKPPEKLESPKATTRGQRFQKSLGSLFACGKRAGGDSEEKIPK